MTHAVRIALLTLVLAPWLVLPSPAGQPAAKSKLAVTDLAKVDEDFAFQGEYFGPVSPRLWGCGNMGLQVVALGDTQFDAVLLSGGLPGAGWDRRTKSKLAGQRHQGTVSLLGDGYRVSVAPHEARVGTYGGRELARLRRIHRISATQDARPPRGAVVLFDGSSPASFHRGRVNEEGLLEVGVTTKMPVRDFHLHLEFRTPYMPYARGQGRGNSGVYIQQRYEVQILDSFALEGADNQCGGLYRQRRPDVNMCLPPLSWQTYDIYFTAARWDTGGSKMAGARITALHNGEPIHNGYQLADKTGSGKPEGPEDRPILLQDHGNPVHFRNIWIVPLAPLDACPAPWSPGSPRIFRRVPRGRLFAARDDCPTGPW